MLHILDDFLVKELSERECLNKLDQFKAVCHQTGIPLAADKTDSQSTTLTFAGI